ncbi:MAG: hypothetical protein HIU83_03700 [Proteobacteria bacterium]|nr:hypothetical protein [Pseudomonadota bacterium]
MKRPYIVIFPAGATRVADFAFMHKDGGACFVDVGWDVPGQHPFHIIDGPISCTETQWESSNGIIIREVTEDDREEWQIWKTWLEYKSGPDGRRATDELAITACERDGALISIDQQIKYSESLKVRDPITGCSFVITNNVQKYEFQIAQILSNLCYHIHPDIVSYIQEKNEIDFDFFKRLFANLIPLEHYLFLGSACVWPGVKRYISGVGDRKKYNSSYEAIIDDNIFPRHLWCFLINGKPYSGANWKKTKLDEFELAHIFPHKASIEMKYFGKDEDIPPFGNFTCAGNIVLMPKGMVKPTDHSETIRSVFYQRHIELYGESTLKGREMFKSELVPDWYSSLKWNDPFKPLNWKDHISSLLKYRKSTITKIVDSYNMHKRASVGSALDS